MGMLRAAVEVVYPDESVGMSGWVHLTLADQYGDDAQLCHGWIRWRLLEREFVELRDHRGGQWPFHVGTIRQFAVWSASGGDVKENGSSRGGV